MMILVVWDRQWLRGCLEDPETTRLCPLTPLSPVVRTGWATNVALTPSRQVSLQPLTKKKNTKSITCSSVSLISPILSSLTATYQKIKPTMQPPGSGGREGGSNYSVTLVIGDKSSESPSISRSTEPSLLGMAGWQQDAYQDSALRSYASLPRPRNKSVFKKFFGKKDGHLWALDEPWGFPKETFHKYLFLMCSAHDCWRVKNSYCRWYLCLEELPQFYFWCAVRSEKTLCYWLLLLLRQLLLKVHIFLFYFSCVWQEQYCVCALCSCRCDALKGTLSHQPHVLICICLLCFWIVVFWGKLPCIYITPTCSGERPCQI